MKRLLALETGRAGTLGCVLLAVVSGVALAQTTGAVNPKPASAEPSMKDEPPPGGCMPIGLTASGEIVFPFQCKEFIERQKAANQKPAAAEDQKPAAAETPKPAAAEQKPDAAEENTAKPSAVTEKPAAAEDQPATAEKKPAAAEEKTAATQEEAAVPESSKPATEPADTVPLPRRAERAVGPPGCTHFRTYNAASGTYTTFEGRRRACR